MATKVGSLIISLALESGAFKSGLTQADRELKASVKRIQAVGQSMQAMGQKLSLAVSLPFAALAKTSVDAALQSNDALAQVQASLASMGGAAKRSAEQLQALASSQMKQSLYDDDDILRQVTASLLTFGKVSGVVFDQAQQAAIDMAAKLGTDLQSASLQVGKALNDPVKGITALTRAGVSFTQQQKDQIKAMVAVGDTASAQKLILAELKNEFGGSAAAAAKANPFTQMKHSLDALKEAVGGVLLKILPSVTAALTSFSNAFNNLSPGAQDIAVKLALVAAVAGPLLTVFGTITTATAAFTGALGVIAGSGGLMVALQAGLAGLAAVLAPIAVPLAAVAAAGLAIYAAWHILVPLFEKLKVTLTETLGPPVQSLVTAIREAFSGLMNGPLGPPLRALVPMLKSVGTVLAAAFGSTLVAYFTASGRALGFLIQLFADGIRFASALAGAMTSALGSVVRMVSGVISQIGERLGAVWAAALAKIETVKQAFFHLYDAVVGHSYVPDMVDGIAAQMARLDAVMVNPAVKATKKAGEAFKALAGEVAPLLARLFPEMQALNDFKRDSALIDKAQAGGILNGTQANEAKLRLGGYQSNSVIQDMVANMSDPIRGAEEVKQMLTVISGAANDNAANISTANVKIVKSFKDMADETLGALNNLASSIKGGGFLDILSAVVGLGLQLGSIGAFGKAAQKNINSAKFPAHAMGTAFAPGGLTLVGERGPELVNMPRGAQVTPNNQLSRLGGNVTNVFKGNLLTPEFWALIQTGDMQAAQAGGMAGERRVLLRQRRMVG